VLPFEQEKVYLASPNIASLVLELTDLRSRHELTALGDRKDGYIDRVTDPRAPSLNIK
jgi:hypothetical protein